MFVQSVVVVAGVEVTGMDVQDFIVNDEDPTDNEDDESPKWWLFAFKRSWENLLTGEMLVSSLFNVVLKICDAFVESKAHPTWLGCDATTTESYSGFGTTRHK